MKVKLLGGLHVIDDDGGTIDVGSARSQAVFAALALAPGEAVTVARLIQSVWGDEAPRTAQKTLQSYISVLRRTLATEGVSIRRVGAAYVLDIERHDVDILRFDDHLDRGDIDAALLEWTGTPLTGLDAPGLEPIIAGLVERWQAAQAAKLERAIENGRAQHAIGPLTELTAELPYRESLWALLMTALYKVGRQADALHAYGQARRHLIEGMGVEPGPRLRDLEAEILRQDPALATPAAIEGRTTMTFVFTDIEGSTSRWEQYPDAMMGAVDHHDALVETALTAHGGRVFHHSGDGMIASFTDPTAAVRGAAEAQRRIAGAEWSAVGGLRVRMAVHSGNVVIRDDEPFGWALNFASRLNAIGHGGQVLLSDAVVEALSIQLPRETDELGVVLLGTRRLRDIAEPAKIFQLVGPDLDRDFPPLTTTGATRRLTTPTKSLVGRDADLAVLPAEVATNRLVTIVGPRGVGTSHLATAVALEVFDSFPDGVARVGLAGVNPAAIPDAVATILEVGTRPGQSVEESVIDWLGDRELLLVLEHWDPASDVTRNLIDAVLQAAPRVKFLCASDHPVGLDGEFLHRLAPLSIDSAIALFLERAAAVGAHVEDSPDLRLLCERLDRMPLALEVAAANAAIHTLDELTDMLNRHELPQLAGANVDLRAMYDAAALALETLPPDQARMLRAAATFAGPFDRAAFAAVCAVDQGNAAAGAALGELVNRSFVHLDHVDGHPRFRLLTSVAETIGQQATAEEQAEAAERFLQFVVAFVEDAADEMRGPNELIWHRRISQHFQNIRAGFERSLQAHDLRRAAVISTGLWDTSFMRLNSEYFTWSDRVIAEFPDGDPALLGPVLGVAALGAWFRDDLKTSMNWANQAIELERACELAFDLPARLALINATVYSGARGAPSQIFVEQADYQRARPELYFHVNVETQNSIMSTWLGATEPATRYGIRAVRLARESKNPSSLSFSLWALGSALAADDPTQAETLLGNSLEGAREVGNGWLTALVQMSLASLRRQTGSPIDAVPLLLDLLQLLWRAGHHSHLWATLRLCGLVIGDLGHDDVAVQLRGWVRQMELAMPPLPGDADALDEQLARFTEAHGEQWVARTERLASTWTTDSVVALARSTLEGCLDEAD